jgi:hypothetical protein
MKGHRGTKILCILVWLAVGMGVAEAADPARLYGKWIERFANGNGMVTELTASSISSYTVDREGQPTSEPHPTKVSCKEVDAGTFLLDFGDGTGFLVHVQDDQTIVLDFPGMGAHRLVRLSPAAD